jgi:D-beta-D-heptose 7-phosphate kinase/D-beta-D-heptose 1-phosphate adenosyltransferase
MSTVTIVTGGFDPLHSGHIAYFKAAKEFGNSLCVGVNSDEWLTRKKGKPFMPMSERMAIIKELKCIDFAIEFNDKDDSACDAIKMALEIFDKVLFCNGGDRGSVNTPEYTEYRNDKRVEFKWGVGGNDKKNSSSWILKKWNML